jgi:hypothetical protein
MEKINLELNREQYRQVLKLLYLGQWMSLSFTDHDDEDVLDLEQYIFSFSHDFESRDLVDYDEEVQLYFPSQEFEEEVFDMIDDYDEFSFWEGMAARMAKRDLIRKYGDSIYDLNEDKRMEEEEALIDKYMAYFEEKGVEEINIPGIQVE